MEEFASFQMLFKNQIKRKLQIGNITFKSSSDYSQKFGMIKFIDIRETEILIDTFQYYQNESYCFMQLYFENVDIVQINNLIIEGFVGNLGRQNKQNLIRFSNANSFMIQNIIASSSNDLDGIILQGDKSQSFQINSLKIESQNSNFNFMVLNYINVVNIYKVQVEKAQFFGYLIDANQINQFNLKTLRSQEILINSGQLFNLKNSNCLFYEMFFQQISSDQSQIAIFYIELEYQSIHQYQIEFGYIDADLSSKNNTQFMLLNGYSYNFYMKNANISKGKSKDFGGCLSFINTFSFYFIDFNIEIFNSTFSECQSQYLGGAISGTQPKDIIKSSQFINCSSQIGGAIYNSYQTEQKLDSTNIFKDNTGYLAIPNFNKQNIQINISEVFEVNSSQDSFQKIGQYLYPGITYIIKLSIKIDGQWYNQFNENHQFGNLYELLVNPSNNLISISPPYLFSQSFPYLLLYAQDLSFDGQNTIDLDLGSINFIRNYVLKSDNYKIYNGCNQQGMEKILLTNSKNSQFTCKYCENNYVSYNGVCQQCQMEYFTDCYRSYSNLKPSYWRSDYEISSGSVYFCAISPKSCVGGSGIGNELCFQGHIGPQCLNCDVKGIYWEEKYSRETDILVDTFQYQQIYSFCFMQLYFENIDTVQINNIIIEGFNGGLGRYKQESLIRFSNANDFKIVNIIASNSNEINEFGYIDADLSSKNNTQFMLLNGNSYNFIMKNSNIQKGKSINFGGCLSFMNTFWPYLENLNIEIFNSTFSECQSQYLGGAISGTQPKDIIKSSQFINCSSQIGGAIYNSHYTDEKLESTNIFKDNTGYLAVPNFNNQPIEVHISEVFEVNSNQGYYKKIEQYLYPGITYIIKLSLEIDGELYSSFRQQNFFGNLYEILVNPSNSFIPISPSYLIQENFPFVIWYAQDISFDGKKTIDLDLGQINFISLYPLKTDNYKIFNGCSEQGMEKIQLTDMKQQQFICKYCEDMFVSYKGICQQCQMEYFTKCYGNYSNIKPSYWRQDYNVDSDNIYYCSNNPESCVGGSGIGNELCYKGHIGSQCLDCDIKGNYWNDKYSRIGFFQCAQFC
ncbi:hypothetical protein ABPG73_017858 [Tetrahymena malaccensis]